LPTNDSYLTELSEKQEQALLAAIEKMPNGIDLRGIVTIILRTGIRRGELERLKWSDITVKVSENLTAGELHVGSRCVPLSNEVITVLSERATRVCTEYVMGKNPKVAMAKVYRDLQVAAKIIGLPRLRFHDLRCTFASRCMACGMSPLTLFTLLGLSTTRLKFMFHHTVSSPTELYYMEQWCGNE